MGRLGVVNLVTIVALILVACSSEEGDWEAARTAESIQSYESFIARHPDSQHLGEAKAALEGLYEARDWKRAHASDTIEAYSGFLARHQGGAHGEEARSQLAGKITERDWLTASKEDSVHAYEAFVKEHGESDSAAEARRILAARYEAAALADARKARTIDALEAFLEKYPESEHTEEVRTLCAEVEEEQEWSRVRKLDTPGGYTRFLEQYADGKHAEDARARQSALPAERWAAVKETVTIPAYEEFLEQFPNSEFAEDARERIDNYRKIIEAQLWMGERSWEKRDFQEALGYAASALEFDPKSHAAHALAGDSHIQLGAWEEALASYQQSIECGSEKWQVWAQKATCLLKLERFAEMKTCYAAVHKRFPDEAGAYVASAAAYLVLCDYRKSWELFERARELGVDHRFRLWAYRAAKLQGGKGAPRPGWKPSYDKFDVNVMLMSAPQFLVAVGKREEDFPPAGAKLISRGGGLRYSFGGTSERPLTYAPEFYVWDGAVLISEYGHVLEEGTKYRMTRLKGNELVLEEGIVKDWRLSPKTTKVLPR